VDTFEILHDSIGYTYGGPRVAQGMESSSDPKDSARRTDLDVGQKSPCETDRKKQCEKK